jgi:hypothetical protein
MANMWNAKTKTPMFVVDYEGEWDCVHVTQQHYILPSTKSFVSIGVGGRGGTMDGDYCRNVLRLAFLEGNEGAHIDNEGAPPHLLVIGAKILAEASGLTNSEGGYLPCVDGSWPIVEHPLELKNQLPEYRFQK